METSDNSISRRFHDIEKDLGDLRVKVEGQGTSLKYLEDKIDNGVSKDAFFAVKWIAYGFASIILTGVMGWLLNLAINK